MRLYKAVVKIKSPGSVAYTHELPKEGLTAAEIMILRSIHGADGVTNLVSTVMDRRAHREELDRLVDVYGAAAVHRVFGPMPQLPVKLADEGDEGGEEEDTEAEAPKEQQKKK